MIFINNNEIISQNNGFDFVLFLVTSFYFILIYIKITFSESRYSSVKVDINEIFINCNTVLVYLTFLNFTIRILCRM